MARHSVVREVLAMPKYLPICLNVQGRPTMVVGGGNVGTERVHSLLECGAIVTVVSPVASPDIQAAADAGRLTLLLRRYQPGDVQDAFLVVVATDDPPTNNAVFQEANAAGQLVSVSDDPPNCNYIFASRVQRGPLTVSIFTHGSAPAFSRRVRRELESWLGPEYGELAELLAALRPRVKALAALTQPQRQRIFEHIVYSEALLMFREGRAEDARALAERIIQDELRLLGVAEARG